MKNKFAFLVGIAVTCSAAFVSCSKNEAAPVSTDYSFTEEFDTIGKVVSRGWVIANNTKPLGTISWIQGFNYISMYHGYEPGKTGVPFNFLYGAGLGANPAISGTDFIMTTSECGSGTANCSNWLISPAVTMKNGDKIKFYTRTYDNPAVAPDRLEVRLNAVNSSADVGRDTSSVGNFTTVLLDINPTYDLEAYPGEWTLYEATITGLPTARKSRVAFRYYVPNGGPGGANGLGVAVDKFEFISSVK